MAQPRDLTFNPSSPRSSSGGADSFKGTPDTRLTAFSSDDAASKSTMRNSIDTTSTDAPPRKLPVNNFTETGYIDKDPFVTSHPNLVSRLSPTASTFNPFGNAGWHVYPGRSSVVAGALSTDLGLSRHLRISSSTQVSAADVYAWLADLEKRGVQRRGRNSVSTYDGQVFLQFTDIRDAYLVHSDIRLAETQWVVDYINPVQSTKDSPSPRDQITTHTGQVVVFAGPTPGSVVDTAWAMETVQTFLQKHGHLFAFVRRSTFPDGSLRAIAEFCDVSVVLLLLKTGSTSVTIEGLHLIITSGSPDPSRPTDLAHALQDMAISKEQTDQLYHQQHAKAVALRSVLNPDIRINPHLPMYPFMLQSPLNSALPYAFDPYLTTTHANPVSSLASITPLSPPYPVIGTLYQTPPSPPLTATNSFSPSKALTGVGRADFRRQNAARINRSPYHNSVGHHNHVDTNRIREGTDVRTTIMLRNIPNKVDQAMLKRIVDESSWGKYDFMYLRIDFANDCNVGYAFINFVDPLDITDFVEARGNQRWNCFKSDKVAEVSYATIQGKDCLVQKFRNSSVMLEAPHYRPKLFFTSNGPMPELAGQEEPFPEPDNQSKMKRSCENAEHVGLFTPNAGQHFRDEQRRRRSQYDRGTRLAALEEYDFETAIQHLYGGAT